MFGHLQLKAFLIGGALATPLIAEIREVPEEYPTIQAALNALQSGDTVLIAPGTYTEALVGPGQVFWMLGDVGTDTTGSLRPVIDPSSLPGSDSLACLTLPGASEPVLENLIFRNGAAMYPRRENTWGSGTGGIASQAEQLTVRRCHFDSTYNAIHSQFHPVTVQHSTFRDVNFWCVWTSSARLIAEDCDIHGHSPFWSLVQFGDSSRLERCHIHNGFADEPELEDGQLLLFSARGAMIRDCIFSADGVTHFPPLQIGGGDCRILNCVFTGFLLRNPIINLNYRCNEPQVLKGNLFFNNRMLPGYAHYMVSSLNGDAGPECLGLIADSNRFVTDGDGFCGLQCFGTDSITRNRFLDNGCASRYGTFDPVFRAPNFRRNMFDSTGLATHPEAGVALDARWNWWGDSTGPYQASQNPEGRGDTAGVYVDVTPWHTDTLFFARTPEPRVVIPERLRLQVFPNPFNTVCRVRLEVPEPVIVRLELFDVLGRRVQELWAGAVGIDKELSFDAGGLAAGVYFVRATETIYPRTLATAKIVLLK